MERHPAGCDPSTFRSLPTPSRIPHSATPNIPRHPRNSDLSPFQDLLNAPGIEAALATLERVAADVVQPVTNYNRYTYLNRFQTASDKLADAFIDHIQQIRRQEIRARATRSPSTRYPNSTSLIHHRRDADDASDDSELIRRKRSSRLATKRPRPRYLASDDDDDDEYLPIPHRKSLPKRSKEIRPNLNDDLAYTLMAARAPPSPPKPHDHKRVKRASSVEPDSSEEDDYDDIAVHRVVRPLPFVRRRPLASDNSSLTPFVEEEDDSTDTETQRREQARLSLKTVMYGPGNPEFSEKEILTVFPARSKRRLKADYIMNTGSRPPVGYGSLPSSKPWQPVMKKLCQIPRDMCAKYINGTYWLSRRPEDMGITGVFRGMYGLGTAPAESVILAKQKLPFSDREYRDGDSGKASPATYVQSGSSSTGSPRPKKPEMQNGHMDIELGPSLSALNGSHQELKGGKDSDIKHRKNGKIHHSPASGFKAWKDLAPYGRASQQQYPRVQDVKQNNIGTTGNPRTTTGLQGVSNLNLGLMERKNQVIPGNTGMHQRMVPQATAKQKHRPDLQSQFHDHPQSSAGRVAQANVKKEVPKNGSEMRKLLPGPARPAQAVVKSSPPQQSPQEQRTSLPTLQPKPSSPPTNQMTVVARGAPTMSALGIHNSQLAVQPQLNLQAQPTLLTTVPVQLAAHPGQHSLHLQQLGNDPRIFAQWQLQNGAIQQTPGLQLSPGFVGVNSIMAHATPGAIPAQNRFVSVQPEAPFTTNALVPVGTATRPEAMGIPSNGVVAPAPVEASAQPGMPTPMPSPPGQQGNLNSQLQQQYQKHYEEMYTKHYQERMKSLKKDVGRDSRS